MPFLVYKTEQRRKRPRLIRQCEISLAGKRGPLCEHAKQSWMEKKVTPLEWELSESGILSLLGFTPSSDFALLIDLKPKVKGNVSIYRLRHVWGRSDTGWTRLALQLQTIFVDKEVKDPGTFKRSFALPNKPGRLVHEFLYLKGGTNFQDWGWGPIGSVNGTLLWPEDLEYFFGKINRSLAKSASAQHH